jgi:hypothetical protein
LDKIGIDHSGVADSHSRRSIGSSGCTNVDPQVARLDSFVCFVAPYEMSRFSANYAEHIASSSRDSDSLADDDSIVPSANLIEPKEALIVDVGDHQPDLVDVTLDHDFRTSFVLHAGKGVAEHITKDLVGESRCFFPPNSGWRTFIT